MSTLNISDVNDDVLVIYLKGRLLFRFTKNSEENKAVLDRDINELMNHVLSDIKFTNEGIVLPEWLPLLCYQLDKTVPLKKGEWLDRFKQMLMEINKEIVTTKDYLFLDLK